MNSIGKRNRGAIHDNRIRVARRPTAASRRAAPNTVVVGKNNNGKSSIIEALRVLAAVVNRKGGTFVRAPRWLGSTLPSLRQSSRRYNRELYRRRRDQSVSGLRRDDFCNASRKWWLNHYARNAFAVEIAMDECASANRPLIRGRVFGDSTVVLDEPGRQEPGPCAEVSSLKRGL